MKVPHRGPRVRSPSRKSWQLASGREALLKLQPELAALAERCGQSGTLDRMEYFLDVPYLGVKKHTSGSRFSQFSSRWLPAAQAKVPQVLFLKEDGGLEAAVLLLEYRFMGIGNGLYSPVYLDSQRTVIAPPAQRASAARQAAELLIRRGGRLVLISYLEDASLENFEAWPADERDKRDRWNAAQLIATQVRDSSHLLRLTPTFDLTLAQMGSHTRRNLRAFMRRVKRDLGGVFVRSAQLSIEEFLELNHHSRYRTPEWVARWRYESVHADESGMLSGLRADDGRWLSLAGGHVQGNTVDLDWQMNRDGFDSFSLVNAMRAFLIADQVEQGRSLMNFEGGTTHSIRSAFLKETTRDLLFAHRAIWPRLLRAIGSRLSSTGPLVNTLRSQELVWRR